MPAKFRAAKAFWEQALAAVSEGRWQETRRTHCGGYHEGGATDGVALATDASGNARILTVLGGTGDHYEEDRYVFDPENRLRLFFLARADVQGGKDEHLVFFDRSGTVLACDDLFQKVGLATVTYCTDDNAEMRPAREIESVLRDEARHRPRNAFRDALLQIDPRAEYATCLP